MKILLSHRGFTLVSAMVAGTILAVGLVGTMSAMKSGAARMKALEQRMIAENYAAELLELFRGMNQTRLKGYLSSNPYKPPANPAGTCAGCSDCTQGACSSCQQCTPYPLGAHINLLDRQHTEANILNRDPIADLPEGNGLEGNTATTQPNRFYQVQVVDVQTLVPEPSLCNRNPSTVALGSTQRYMVTVGVTWVPEGKAANEAERVVLSTLLPE